MFKLRLFLWIGDQSLYHDEFVQHIFSFMVLCKQRQLWVKCHWEMLQFSFMKMKAFSSFYGLLWAVLGSWQVPLGPPLPTHPLHARVYLGARWTSNSPAERVVLSSILWGALCMGTGRGDLAGEGMASPQTHKCQSGGLVLMCVEPQSSWRTW